MNLASVKPSSANQPRCRHFTADGRRRRLAVLNTRSHLCFRHSALIAGASQTQNDSEDLFAELLSKLSEFNSGVDINKFLARLLNLVTKGTVSPRRASVLAYIANQLLHPPRHRSRQPLQDPAWYRRAVEAAIREQEKSSS